MVYEPSNCAGPGSTHDHPPNAAASTAPLAESTATTCAPNTPVAPAGKISGLAGSTRPEIVPMCVVSDASG
jgi:hypothetical protein